MVGWQLTNSMDMSLRKLWEMVKNRETWHVAVHGVAKSQDMIEQLNNTNNPYMGQEVQSEPGISLPLGWLDSEKKKNTSVGSGKILS